MTTNGTACCLIGASGHSCEHGLEAALRDPRDCSCTNLDPRLCPRCSRLVSAHFRGLRNGLCRHPRAYHRPTFVTCPDCSITWTPEVFEAMQEASRV